MKIFKKLLYILPLLAMLSCTERWEDNLTNDGKLSTTISVVLPQIPDALPQTRAMAMNPQMRNLYLAVFDENGYLLEYVKADATTEMASENEKTFKYKVSLTPTDFPTYVHFIGNAPETISFGTEVEAVGKLFTEGGEHADAYWQRIVFPEGIKKNSDGTLEASVQTALRDVRLVRNFAWIKLQLGENVKNFTIDSYCVMNTRTKGSVAPYNTSSSQFAEFAHQQTYDDLISEGYNGFIPANATLDKTIPDESTWFKASGVNADNYAYYVFEREKPSADPTFILLKGTYTPEGGTPMTERYYKVDLRQGNGDYFPIIRNFRYNIVISSIMHEGHATAAAAVAGAGSGDVSTAIETEDFTNISNNVARIFVSYTDTTLVNQMNDLKFRYKFMVFETKDADGNVVSNQQVLNDNVTIEADAPGTVISSYTKANEDATDGWREITISTTELGSSRKTQDIIIKGQVTIGEGANAKTYQLQRKVTLNLRPKYTMQLVCNPTEIQKNLGEPFDLIIKVPGGLGSAMFPLEFQLEAVNQSMTPNLGDDLPVVTGKSITGTDKTTIGFIKHLEWDDYDALLNEGGYKSVVCHFKSNKAESATAIYAQNKYFNQASTTLGNYTPGTFSNLTFSPSNLPNRLEQPVSFTFAMSDLPSQGYVTVGLANLAPADDETRLTYIGVQDGMACYSFNPTQKTETLKLKNTATGVEAKVALSAYHFVDAEKSMDYTPNEFRNLTFNPGTINNKVNENVAFSFTMTNMPTGEVTVVLTHLVKSPTETRLTLTKDEGDVKYYTFKPTTLDNTLQLQNTASGVTAKAQLSATNFPTAEKTMQIRNSYVIPAGKIDVGDRPYWGGSDNNSITFTIYTSSLTNNNAKITTFQTTWNNPYNPAEIELSQIQYNAVMENGGNIYVRFSRNGTNYVATANLQTLLNGDTVELDW